ncbi:hypothetical protein AMTRI_Chr05g61090 [Amborella trichopoda]
MSEKRNIRLKNVKAPNLLERAKEEIEAIMHTDIDENTPLDEVKAPNVFECAKEEIEALVQTKNRGGFCAFLGRKFEKFCSSNRLSSQPFHLEYLFWWVFFFFIFLLLLVGLFSKRK